MSSKQHRSEPKSVFAHFILGVSAGYSKDDWILDICEAKAAGIDAFMLNAGATDPCNNTQLANAYTVAEELGFKVSISFDYLAPGPWEAAAVISTLKKYCDRPAQFRFNGLPLVSTFEGASNASDWRQIRAAVPIFFIPTWTSLGPYSLTFKHADGAFSWDAWPLGASDKTDAPDRAWQLGMRDKAYMMGVSPWFYTNLPCYGKNWLWRGDDLWHYRWQQIQALQPALVQVSESRSLMSTRLTRACEKIISWNDYGECHYIGPIHDSGLPGITSEDPQGAHRYVDGMPHDCWRDLLPYYIEAYKSDTIPTIVADKLHFWYRLSPASANSSAGTVGNAPWEAYTDVNTVVQDKVFFTALLIEPALLSLQVGDHPAEDFEVKTRGIFHSSVPFHGRTGVVRLKIVRNGAVVASGTGQQILARSVDGITNYNAWVGGVDEDKK